MATYQWSDEQCRYPSLKRRRECDQTSHAPTVVRIYKLIREQQRLLTKVQLTRPGGGRNPGAMRNFLAEGTVRSESQTVAVAGYKSIWGLDLDSYQVHARCILMDTETGYRSQFVPISGIVSL